MSEASVTLPVIDLAKPRILSFKDRGVKYRFTFNPISRETWRQYFSAIVTTSQQQGKEIVNTTETTSAKLGLVRAALSNAVGYVVPGDTALTAVPNWQDVLPIGHRLVLGDMLVATGRIPATVTEGDEVFAPITLSLGEERVEIESTWGEDEDGNLRKYSPMVHFFKAPTPEQQRRFARDSSRSMVTGGSRAGKTVWMGAQMTLAALYDELVTRVEGYVVDGKPLDTSEHCATYMDTFHKVVAAAQLFSPAEVDAE
jgi:hypothetical protein